MTGRLGGGDGETGTRNGIKRFRGVEQEREKKGNVNNAPSVTARLRGGNGESATRNGIQHFRVVQWRMQDDSPAMAGSGLGE